MQGRVHTKFYAGNLKVERHVGVLRVIWEIKLKSYEGDAKNQMGWNNVQWRNFLNNRE
jgi:hypothetical protein